MAAGVKSCGSGVKSSKEDSRSETGVTRAVAAGGDVKYMEVVQTGTGARAESEYLWLPAGKAGVENDVFDGIPSCRHYHPGGFKSMDCPGPFS